MTPREAIEATIKMWRWIAEDGRRDKSEYFELYDIDEPEENECFLCDIWVGECSEPFHESNCPLDTSEHHCSKRYSPYGIWGNSGDNRIDEMMALRIAEICEDSSTNVLSQFDMKKDKLYQISKSKALFKTLEMYTGLNQRELLSDINEKAKILKWMVKQNLATIDEVGRTVAEYYTETDDLLKKVRRSK